MQVSDLDAILKNIFKDVKSRDVDVVYEKSDNADFYKLIYVLHLPQIGEIPILMTKFIFKVDLMKLMVLDDTFSYLYDMNCQYRMFNFKDDVDLESKVLKIFKKKLFGANILEISKFMLSPATFINEELKKISAQHTVFNVKYDPKISVMPCEAQSFDFSMDVDNAYKVDLNIRKNTNQSYTYTFEINGEYIRKDVNYLQNISALIASTLKNNLLI